MIAIAHHADRRVGEQLESTVAGFVALRVVEALEEVEIGHDHGERRIDGHEIAQHLFGRATVA